MKALLKVLKAVCYVAGFPLLIALVILANYKIYQQAPYNAGDLMGMGIPFPYALAAWLGAIIVIVLAVVWLIATLVITRKKAKRSIERQMVSVTVWALILTVGFGALLNLALPDLIGGATSSTLFAEDLKEGWEDQAKFNGNMVKKFVTLNVVNGTLSNDVNYYTATEGETAEETAVGTYTTGVTAVDFQGVTYFNPTATELTMDDVTAWFEEEFGKGVDPLALTEDQIAANPDTFLYSVLYNNYVLYDYHYCYKAPEIRHAVARGIYENLKVTNHKLVAEGFNNKEAYDLMKQNFTSIDRDGYVTFDDCLLEFANSSRQTIPVLVNLILGQRDIGSGDDVSYDYKQYDPELGENDESVYRWTILDMDGNGMTVDLTSVVGLLKNAAVVVDNPDGTYTTVKHTCPTCNAEYTEGETYCPKDGAAITDSTVTSYAIVFTYNDVTYLNIENLHHLLDAVDISFLNGVKAKLHTWLTSDEYYGLSNIKVDELFTDEAFNKNVLQPLLWNASNTLVANENVAGSPLNVAIVVEDDGSIMLAIRPTNAKRGVLGYQYMAWLDSNNLLFAIISLYSVSNYLFLMGGVVVFLNFIIGLIRIKERDMKSSENA